VLPISPVARRNELRWSEAFDDAAWSKTGVTIASNDSVSPSGSTTADHILETASAGAHYIGQAFIGVAPSSAYTFQVFVRPAERDRVFISCGGAALNGVGGSGADRVCIFDMTTGKWAVSALQYGPQAISMGSGWWLLSITVMTGGGPDNDIFPRVGPCVAASVDGTYTGTAGNGIVAWGGQLAKSAAVSRYIYTASAGVSSAADYSISNGMVSYTTAPAAGRVMTWSGEYYWRCRFTKPQMQLTEFLHDLWQGQVEFKTVKGR
jgi:hypothetical protein